ncbi:hypothetical protein MLD38_027879 [Melastoma candidum]|uniref:Uncharacterized protein n=1 Tax=Melastoma candidum TaxID=119954 RepID=A0ACB9N5F2_9MYRT|nr:hypothetical protein MLD38_027879 [Melastoma candidum]
MRRLEGLMSHEEVGGFDVAVDDLAAVEVGEAGEDLVGQVGELELVAQVDALQGTAVHELQEDLNLAIVVVHIMAPDHIGVVDVAEDLNLSADLEADGVLIVVAVDNLEGK